MESSMRRQPSKIQILLLISPLLLSARPIDGVSRTDDDASLDWASTVIRVDCRLYCRRDCRRVGPDHPVLLDCRPGAAADYARLGYAYQRLALLLMPPKTAGDRPVWTLGDNMTLSFSSMKINILPAGAFDNLAEKVTSSHLISLKHLRQPQLDLAALAKLPQLRHLEVADSNVTCLTRGQFDSAPKLISLRLVENHDLKCIQPDALATLTNLAELSILRSPSLKSISGAATAPALTSLQLGMLELPRGALCKFRHIHRLRLSRMPQDPQLLAGLYSLRSLHVDIADSDLPMALIQLSPAACAQWPDGQLLLNGISLANNTLMLLSQDFQQFCTVDEMDNFSKNALQLCSSGTIAADSCWNVCQVDGTTPASLISSTPSAVTVEISESMVAAAAAADAKNPTEADKGSDGDIKTSGAVWHMDQHGVLGTTLLTAGAFLGGVLAAAFCCSSRHLGSGSLKPSILGSMGSYGGAVATVSISGIGGSGRSSCSAGGTRCDLPSLDEDEPIRLIGYSIKASFLQKSAEII